MPTGNAPKYNDPMHIAPAPSHFTISAFCYALGYGVGLAAFMVMAARRRLVTLGMMRVMTAGLVGGLVCACVAQWVLTGAEGKSVLGGLAGGYATVWVYKKYLGIRRSTGDLFAVAMSAGEAVGRWGCYFAGCCYGRPSHVPWAIWQHGAWRHPTQIYSSLASAAILVVLLTVENKRPVENTLFFLQGTLFCAARFVIEFYRAGSVSSIGLSTAQIACVFGFLFFSFGLARLTRQATTTAQHTGAEATPASSNQGIRHGPTTSAN